VEDWAEIRRLHRAERMPIKVIARVMGHSKNTVRSALASDVSPQYERVPSGSIVDEVEPRIRELLAAWPTMPATVIAERLVALDPRAQRPGGGVAPGVFAAGPGWPHELCGRGDWSARFLVSQH
jgi:transposase